MQIELRSGARRMLKNETRSEVNEFEINVKRTSHDINRKTAYIVLCF